VNAKAKKAMEVLAEALKEIDSQREMIRFLRGVNSLIEKRIFSLRKEWNKKKR